MTDETTTTGKHDAVERNPLHDEIVSMVTALRIAKWLFGLLAALGIVGVLYTNATLATINARLTHVERNVDAHAASDGHATNLRETNENATRIRVLTESVDRRLESIDENLTRLARQVEP